MGTLIFRNPRLSEVDALKSQLNRLASKVGGFVDTLYTEVGDPLRWPYSINLIANAYSSEELEALWERELSGEPVDLKARLTELRAAREQRLGSI